VVETRACTKYGQLNTLSPQQLVDCGPCGGCNGGNAGKAYKYFIDSKSEAEAAYPYTAKTETCKYNSAKGRVNTTDNIVVKGGTTPMMSALKTGPISVAINASS